MDLWCPSPNQPHLFEWWFPLVQASARARSERLPWPIYIDEFRLVGRVSRPDDRDVWIYEHVPSGGSLCVDVAGDAYRFVATPEGPSPGRFHQCKLATALRRAGLPRAVGSFRYAEPPPAPARAAAAGSDSGDRSRGPAPRPRVVRRGHLTLV